MAAAALLSSRCKHVGIDRKGDARLGVAEALRDRDDINPAGDQLAGMGMPQRVERDLWHPNAFGKVAPVRRHSTGPRDAAPDWKPPQRRLLFLAAFSPVLSSTNSIARTGTRNSLPILMAGISPRSAAA